MHIFITGIGTDVGKTLVSAILVEALEADYFKPVQAGDLQQTDTDRVRNLVSNPQTVFHPGAVSLTQPMSPHAAAALDGVSISAKKIKRPVTQNNLVVEGAGGLLVPLNERECVIDLIKARDRVVVVSRHYLGSINHTLLTVEALQNRGLKVTGLVFNGNPNPTTETILQTKTGLPVLGRLEDEPYFDKAVVRYYADKWQNDLKENGL